MNRDPSVEEPGAEDDSSLGHLVDEVTRRLQAGERIDLEDLLAAHPREAERLRTILPTLEAMADLARPPERVASGRPPADLERDHPFLIGDYRILHEIGRGGMGVVYEAEQRSLGRRVALKVLPLAAAMDARQFQRFQLEARAAACLHHQNIVPVFAIGTEGGVPYYAMQYIEGQSLAEVIRDLRRAEGLEWDRTGPDRGPQLRSPDPTTTTVALNGESNEAGEGHHTGPRMTGPAGGPFAVRKGPIRGGRLSGESLTPLSPYTSSTRTGAYARTIAGLGLQAADALDHAHIRGILHRDIKPGNLLLDAEGRLWVADFGLAQIQGCHGPTLSGDVMGTLRYMSPEQALGKRVVIDGRTDIYSLGVTLYEMLTLRPALTGRDRAEILRRIADEEPLPLRRSNPAVPIDLETIIRKAMYKDPADRYATARDLADDLRRFLDDQPIAAARPGPWVKTRKWTRRHREATLAIVVVAAVVIFSLGAWAWDRTSRRIQSSQRVGRMLEAARASLQSNDSAAAQQHLAEARGHLDQARDGRGPLGGELAQLSREVTARIEAEERYRQFQDLRDRAQSLMYHLGGDERASARDRCRTALRLYRVLDADTWEPPPAFGELPPVLQAAARDGIYELLYLLARLEVNTTYTAADRSHGHRRAIDALGRLESLTGPAMATSLWMAQSWEAIGEKELGRQAIARAEGLATRTALGEFMLGEYRSQEGKLDDALACFTRALRHRPDHLLSLQSMGRTLAALGRHEAAEAMFTGAIALSPKTSFTYYERAVSRQSQGKLDLAMEDLTRMAELSPGDYLPEYTQASILKRRGDTAQALAMYDKVIEHNPRSFSSRLNRGVIYSQLGQLEKARADFTVVIDRLTPSMDLVPRNRNWVDHLINARMARADASARMGRRAEALEDLEKALGIGPNPARIYHCRAAKVWMPAGRLKEAIEDLSRATQHEPGNPTHLRHRSECYYRLGNFDAALADITKAVGLDPDEPAVFLERGAVLVQQGRHRDAVADVERALGLKAKGKGRGPTKFDFYNAACVYSLASAAVAKEPATPGRGAAVDRHADRALDLLRRAVAAGWGGSHDLEHMREDTDLDPVRHRPGFGEILKSAGGRRNEGDEGRLKSPGRE